MKQMATMHMVDMMASANDNVEIVGRMNMWFGNDDKHKWISQ